MIYTYITHAPVENSEHKFENYCLENNNLIFYGEIYKGLKYNKYDPKLTIGEIYKG